MVLSISQKLLFCWQWKQEKRSNFHRLVIRLLYCHKKCDFDEIYSLLTLFGLGGGGKMPPPPRGFVKYLKNGLADHHETL